jgi:hypothetical protein
VISDRQHFADLLAGERARTNLLVAVAVAIGLYTYRELERRQKLEEGRQDLRRAWEDEQFAASRDDALGHRERSAAVRRLIQVGVGTATLLGTLAVAYTALLAAHVI